MAGLGTRSTIERVEIGNSWPKAARASALPDTCDETSFGGCVDSLFCHIPSDFVVAGLHPTPSSCNGEGFPPGCVRHGKAPMTCGAPRPKQARPPRANRTSTVDLHNAAPAGQRRGEGQALRACGCAGLRSLGWQRPHQAPWHGGGGWTRPAP
jgi:hypothetical protein